MPERMWRRGPDGEIVRRAPAEPQPETPEVTEAVPDGGPDTPASAAPLPRAHLGLALRLGFRDTYDYLGAGLLLSFLTVLLEGVGFLGGHAAGAALLSGVRGVLGQALPYLTGVLGWVLLGGPVRAGLFRYARNAAAREEPEITDFTWGFRKEYGRSTRLALVQGVVALLLLGNALFYFLLRQFICVVLGVAFLYLFLFWLLAGLYQWPLLVVTGDRVRVVVRKSVLLTLDNFPFTLLLGLTLMVGQAVLWATAIGGILLGPHSLAMFTTQATRELLRRYGVLGPDPTLDPISDEVER